MIPISKEDLTDDERKLISGLADACEKQIITQSTKTNFPIILDIRQALEDGASPDAKEIMFSKPQQFMAELTAKTENILTRNVLGIAQNASGFATIHLKNICSKSNKYDYPKINMIYDPEYIGHLIQADGIIKSMTINDNRVVQATFWCKDCATENIIAQNAYNIVLPACCRQCGSHAFRLVETKRIPLTIMEIEELPENDDDQNSSITVFAEGNTHRLLADNQIKIGTRVRVTAIVGTTPAYAHSREENAKSMQKMVLLANYLEPLEEELISTTITSEDEKAIVKLSQDPDIFNILRDSIAPHIEGMTDIKEAVMYALFGGVRRSGKVVTRGIINLLMVSDPSQGKSSIFEYIKKITPKCKKVLGGATSKAGLGAGAVRSEITGKFSIEAGALILANKGVLLIDELDKMTHEDMASLHESMESCTVTKTIVGQNRSFNAETTIIGACNPKSGRFDPIESVTKQINLPPAIISRFDAIFAMRDIPNSERDKAIITRIYRNYAMPESVNPIIAPDLYRKYITVAKKLNPEFSHSDEVQETLSQFYVGLRSTSGTANGQQTIPITTRQAESILRFAEASARIRLSQSVEKEDIERGIKIVMKYLREFGYDPTTGRYDIDRVVSDMSSSSRNIAKIIIGFLADKQLRSYEEIQSAVKQQIPTMNELDFEDALGKLQHQGELTESRRGFYQVVA